jgi:long-chain fatty acid transport protein
MEQMAMKFSVVRGAAAAVTLSATIFAMSNAEAFNGIYLSGNGPMSSGMGGVSIALPQDATAAVDNPAGMAEVGARVDVFGFLLPIAADSTFGSPENHLYSRVIIPAPGLGLNYQISPQWTFGVAVTGVGVKSHYGEPVLPVLGAQEAKTSLTVVNISPTITYKPLTNLSIGASLVLGVQQFLLNGILAPDSTGQLQPVPSHGNSWAGGVGAGIGALWTPVPMMSLGVSYFTKTRFSALSGYKNDVLAQSGGHIDSPSRYGVGVAVRPLPGLTLGVDYLRFEWSKAAGYNMSASFNWHDQNVVRFGAAYEINSRWTVRAGYSAASSYFDSDHTLANVYGPGISTHAVTAGFTYAIDKKSAITGAIEYGIPRSIVGTGPSTGTNISSHYQAYTLGYTYKF